MTVPVGFSRISIDNVLGFVASRSSQHMRFSRSEFALGSVRAARTTPISAGIDVVVVSFAMLLIAGIAVATLF